MGRRINKAIRGIEGYLPVAADDLQGVAAQSIASAPDFSISGVLSLAHSADAKIYKDRPELRSVCSSGLFFKEYRYTGHWRLFRKAFFTAAPFRALLASEMIRECGIAAPQVLIALESSSCGKFSRDCLVTEALPETTVFADRIEMPSAELIPEIMPLLVSMHDCGVAPGGLGLRHFYLRSGDTSVYGEGYRWGVVKLEGSRLYTSGVPGRIRCREVASLAVSAAKIFIGFRGGMTDELLKFYDFCAECYLHKGGIRLNRLAYRRQIKIFMKDCLRNG